MRFIARLLAGLFGIAVGLAIVSWLAGQNLLQPTPLLAQVPSAAYSQLAQQLPKTLSHVVTISTDEQVLLGQFINADLVRQLVHQVVTGELKYAHGQGEPPALDLSPISTQVTEGGAVLSPSLETLLEEPHSLTNLPFNRVLRPVTRLSDLLRWLAPLAALVLAALVWLVGGHRRYRYLAEGLVVAMVVVAGAIAAGLSLPSLIGSTLSTSALAPLTAPVKAVVQAIALNVNHQLVRGIIGLGAVAVVLLLCQLIFGRRPRHRRH